MTIREITELIEEGSSLKQIAQAYSEIANLKIKRLRAQLERNRIFFQEISFVYGLVRTLASKKRLIVPKPKKRICLMITSNYRFYGQINSDLIEFFISHTKNLDTDISVIGKAAIDYFKANPNFGNLQQILLKADQPSPEELNSLVSLIKDYNQVLVFYAKLKTLLVQQPDFKDLTAFAKIETLSPKINFRFIFEPELPKILSFFDSQILTLLLEETFLESEVSRTASRFISMDQAETEANKILKDYHRIKAYLKRNLDSNKILENFASMMAVRRT